MRLLRYAEYKGKNIYINVNDNCYVIYDDGGDVVAKEAVRIFVLNDIDINMPIFAYNTSCEILKNDIDVDDVISRAESISNLRSWIEV